MSTAITMVVHKNRKEQEKEEEKNSKASPGTVSLNHLSCCMVLSVKPCKLCQEGVAKTELSLVSPCVRVKKASRNTVPFVLSPFTGIYHLLEPQDNHAIKSTSAQAPDASKNLSSSLCPQSLIQLKATDWLLPGAGKAQPLTGMTVIAVLGEMERPGLLTP